EAHPRLIAQSAASAARGGCGTAGERGAPGTAPGPPPGLGKAVSVKKRGAPADGACPEAPGPVPWPPRGGSGSPPEAVLRAGRSGAKGVLPAGGGLTCAAVLDIFPIGLVGDDAPRSSPSPSPSLNGVFDMSSALPAADPGGHRSTRL